jgi:hypothetical protein
MFTLRKHNLAELQQQLPRDMLTKTFKDAMDITKRLGLKYIWIDSLCIIQDDEDDWLRESALMSDVYGSSYLTIAATSAIDGYVGCFRERNPAAICCQRLNLPYENGNKAFDCYNFDIYQRGIIDSPLASRAWALQERFLTTRTIHFTSQQLIWECGQQLACESFPENMPMPLSTKHSWFQKRKSNPNIWVETVAQYSRCNLTKAGDKLIAISGIAKWLQQKTNDRYINGLWWKNIEHLLLWSTESGSNQRPEMYRAPSWSWASVDGPVRWPFWGGVNLENSTLVSRVIEVTDVYLADIDEQDKLQNGANLEVRRALRVQCPGIRTAEVSSILQPNTHSMDTHGYEMDCFADVSNTSRYQALPMTIRAPKRGIQSLVTGLLVERCGKNIYRRVGLFDIREKMTSFKDASPELKLWVMATDALRVFGPWPVNGQEQEMVTLV